MHVSSYSWTTLSKCQCAALTVIKEAESSLLPWVYSPRPVWKMPQQFLGCHLSGQSHLFTPPRKVTWLSVGSWEFDLKGLMACGSREKCNLVAGKAALGSMEQCRNQVSRNKDGIPGEGPPRVVRARTFGIQAGVIPCGKRFFSRGVWNWAWGN